MGPWVKGKSERAREREIQGPEVAQAGLHFPAHRLSEQHEHSHLPGTRGQGGTATLAVFSLTLQEEGPQTNLTPCVRKGS